MKVSPFLGPAFMFLLLLFALPSKAEDFVISHRHSDYDYFIRILEAALKAADGEHSLEIITPSQFVPQNRILRALADETTPANIEFTGHTIEREQALTQIDVPLSKGIFGYRVLLVSDEGRDKLRSARTIDELRRTTHVGSATSWPDTLILEHAGFQVTKSTYSNLWRMMRRGRFDAFPRSIYEARAERQRYGIVGDNVFPVVDSTLMLHYKFDLFYYLAKDDVTRAAIVRQGLDRLIQTGEFDRLFYNDPAIKRALSEVTSFNRRTFELENPFLSERIKNLPAKYWHTFN